jgi:hypothetical protein
MKNYIEQGYICRTIEQLTAQSALIAKYGHDRRIYLKFVRCIEIY